MTLRRLLVLAAFAVLVALPTTAAAKVVARNGEPVRQVASGIAQPTSFAFSSSTVFVGAGPALDGRDAGGIYAIRRGRRFRVPGSPTGVLGLAWRSGTLYVAAQRQLFAFSGWDGSRFAGSRVVYAGDDGFPGFSGLAIAPDGRLWAGLILDDDYDHAKDPFPISQAVVSLDPDGRDFQIVARGIRQPFQLTFPKGATAPFVSSIGQDAGTIPPDAILIARPGQDYGFPACTHADESACGGFARPWGLLPRHASPMGIGSYGRNLYVALFGGLKGAPQVVTIPLAGGRPAPFLQGFTSEVMGLGINGRWLYAGDLAGRIYRVRLG